MFAPPMTPSALTRAAEEEATKLAEAAMAAQAALEELQPEAKRPCPAKESPRLAEMDRPQSTAGARVGSGSHKVSGVLGNRAWRRLQTVTKYPNLVGGDPEM